MAFSLATAASSSEQRLPLGDTRLIGYLGSTRYVPAQAHGQLHEIGLGALPGAHVGSPRGAGLLDLATESVALRGRAPPSIQPAGREQDSCDGERILRRAEDRERVAAESALIRNGIVDVREAIGNAAS